MFHATLSQNPETVDSVMSTTNQAPIEKATMSQPSHAPREYNTVSLRFCANLEDSPSAHLA
jgi:hypothetical protein